MSNHSCLAALSSRVMLSIWLNECTGEVEMGGVFKAEEDPGMLM